MYILVEAAIQYTLTSNVKVLGHSTDFYLFEEGTNAKDIFSSLPRFELRTS
jgi:hypothetical protein